MTEKTPAELIEETKTLVVEYQAKHDLTVKELGEKGAATDVSLKAMETKFGELTETIQKASEASEAEAQKVKDLELTIARGLNSSEKGEIETTDEIKEAFHKTLRLDPRTFAATKEINEANIKENVAHFYKHLPAEAQAVMVKNLMLEGSDPAGGMWCPVPVANKITTRVFETSPMRQLSTVLNVNTQAVKFALDDEEAIAEVASEIDARSETNTPEFGEVRIDVHELYAKPKASLSFIEDSTINAESWLSGKVSRKIGRKQNTAFVVGTGDKSARGPLDYANAAVNVYERNKLGTLDTAVAVTLDGDDLIALQANLLEEYQSNARWMFHRLGWAEVLKLKDGEDRYLMDPMLLFSGLKPQLLGTPVVLAGDMPPPTAGVWANNQFICMYGDFREGYTILDRIGISVIRDNITESGFVKWFFRTRYGGGVTNFQAIKRLRAKTA